MALHVALNHRTHYRYDRLVSLSPHVVRLRPAPHCRTPILSYSLRVTPEKHFINWQQDPQGNYLARLVFPEATPELLVEVDLVAEMSVINPFDFFLDPSVETCPFDYEPPLRKDLAPFLEALPPGPLLREFLAGVNRGPVRTIDFLVDLNQRLQRAIKYIIRMEPGVQTPEQTLELRSGSCRDTGWLLVQVLRHLGLAARFVSGYLIQLTPDVKSLDGPSGTTVDFTDLHAWAEVYLPGAGWVGLDPTSGLMAGEGHIPLACAPDPVAAAPVTGAVDKCEVTFTHTMNVTRIFESPRVTKPYTEEQWREIESLGHLIDADLERGDVRLTMGGEPTFVSIDDMDGAEWNTAALGTNKRKLAGSLIKRLRKQFGPGGLLHYGQGKWYPGESLPRWALGCYWRPDGVPIWKDDSLICDETIDYHHGSAQAQRFITRLTQILGVDSRFVIPAYEDIWYYLWKERRLPINVDPLESQLKDEEERARLARLFEQGLSKIAGFVLPLQRRFKSNPGAYWASGPWFFRTEHMFLLPGDSPIGYRLPIDSLAWVAPGQYPYLYEVDPHVQQPPLPEPRKRGRQQQHLPGAARAAARPGFAEQHLAGETNEREHPRRGESAPWIIRTAVCVEPRQGRLHVFMPPVRFAEDYLDLIAGIEDTAAELKLPVIIEGEKPPKDARLNHIHVTPDPGVIEVNLHPARNWDELVDHTTVLYEEARQTRLGTEKFMLDGRHIGTGGGNHIVIGGQTPSDSPLLRRPDLLRSLVGYWHNHPALSFLFSGLFIGPTSQHPRVDDARNDSLYELEIAFRQIPEHGDCLPWVVDRAFRNLLIDVTGNTHRAEFCIDKLYPPESSSGRLGLLELRSFEMPPHARMSLTQQLLLRSLIAAFWKQPYDKKLARWGTELHDRFMLPHFVAQDFNDVLSDLNAAGYPLKPEWFAPHHEFRFPQHGTIAQRGIVVELRHALEPWNVMGEEAGAGGTVRFVDSSVERMQIKVNGMTDTRHFVACNGRRVPLHPTGTVGEFVAGVRYRAWQPASCLHPMIPVHTPLVIDIVDSWNGRSAGGCTYHVAHPGGRSYETFPVNAYEAESRRRARFFHFGHTPGPMDAPPDERNAEFPFTLDLRRP
ncbi:MAG TPA: transglutaminase family protein [Verrucomicrobiae bacterium]|nr:transglutaminase family protein [Verrucomicrobiae bacterium]